MTGDRPGANETDSPGVGATPAATAEESEKVLRWLESDGVRLVHVEGKWTCPVERAGRHQRLYTDLVESRAAVVPFDEQRSVARCTGRFGSVAHVITAIVFVKADVARIPEVAEEIAALDGISEVYSVTGQIDLIALVRVRQHEDVASVVADKLNKVPGVLETETHIAFRAYSQHDLESAFSLGLD